MAWTVLILDDAEREAAELPGPTRFRIAQKIARLAEAPFPPGIKKLRHRENLYRLRVGEYRILYRADSAKKAIEVFRIRHRRDVYRRI